MSSKRTIYITSGIGEEQTKLSAFDAALLGLVSAFFVKNSGNVKEI